MTISEKWRAIAGLPLTEATQLDEATFKPGDLVGIFTRDKKALAYTGEVLSTQKDGNIVIKLDQKSAGQSQYVSPVSDLIKIVSKK
jgi:hypothetical protein